MSDEIEPTHQADAALNLMQNTLDEFLATADVHAVYGEPIEHGDTLIIPSAEVLCAMGFGAGYGSGSNVETEGAEGAAPASGSGGGGGGGGRVFSRPVAIVVAGPDGVRVEPVIDVTKIALAWLKIKKCKTNLPVKIISPKLYERIQTAESWLHNNNYPNKVLKWETEAWGEIPADYGRK